MPKGFYIRKKRSPREIRKCLQCGKEFEVKKILKQKYCCNKCKHEITKNMKRNLEVCEKISKTKLYKKNSKEHNKNISDAMKKLWKNEIYRKKQKDIQKIVQNKPEIKAKHRFDTLNRILKNNGQFYNYNPDTIPVFKEFKNMHNLKNCYFATEPHEYVINKLGYSLDFIDFDHKLIIEVDEKQHNRLVQKAKDEIRQKEIQEFYPDFKFLRFKDEEMNKILEIKIGELIL